MRIKTGASEISIILIIIVMTIISSNINWGKERWRGILEADAKGYYAYLPAVFIYNDLNFRFFDTIEKGKYYDSNLYYDYRAYANGKAIDKYYAGTAVAQIPFFLVAHALSMVSDNEADGYSAYYPVFVNIAAIFYLFVGLVFINRSLKLFFIRDKIRALVLFAAVFGTNLFYYTIGEPGMSHVFSFAFISAFFYYSKLYFVSFEIKHVPLMAFLLGMIVLIRPVNGLIVFIIPFVAGDFFSLRKGFHDFTRKPGFLWGSLIIFLGLISIQLIIYRISTGSFVVYSYTGEGFNFLKPHFFEILLSFKKGLFIYTPMYLLSFTGCLFLWKSSRFQFYAWLLFFILITFIFSSWSNWYYGGSFSSRVYVEYIPVFMALLAMALQNFSKKAPKAFLTGAVFFFILLCQIQTYQYRYYQIHWSDMNRQKYLEVFMRLDKL